MASAAGTAISAPTDTKSDKRRSETGFTHPARGMPPNYTVVILTERYWGLTPVACRCQDLVCFVVRLVAGRSFPSAGQDVRYAVG